MDNTYIKFDKPIKVEFDKINPSCYEAYLNNYNVMKEYEGTIVMNEGTDNECIFVREESMGSFHITSLSRADFETRGYDASNLTDGDMERIAKKMSDTYVGDGSFWSDIDFWAEEYGCPKIGE